MSGTGTPVRPAAPWLGRVEATDWDTVRAGLDNLGCAVTGPLLSPAESAEIAALYGDDSRFRSTVNMSRHRFGEGEYRYFAEPFPDAVTELKQALYPRLDRCSHCGVVDGDCLPRIRASPLGGLRKLGPVVPE